MVFQSCGGVLLLCKKGVVSLRCGVTIEQLSKFIREGNNMQREDSEGEGGEEAIEVFELERILTTATPLAIMGKRLRIQGQNCLEAFDFVRVTGILFTEGSIHLSIPSLYYRVTTPTGRGRYTVTSPPARSLILELFSVVIQYSVL